MKKTFLWFTKAFIAGLIAFGIVSGLCFFYYNLPIHHENKSGATDYLWDKEHLSFRGTEGFAFTKTDENGFVNTFPAKKDTIDVLIMGSSHAEGFNVSADENLTYVLNQKFEQNNCDKYAYNIGTSGHSFLMCLRNLNNAIREYQPEDCVVIELPRLDFDIVKLRKFDNGTLEVLSSHNSGLMYFLQKSDFLRLVYSQISNFTNQDTDSTAIVAEQQYFGTDDWTEYCTIVDKMLSEAAETTAKNNCRLIVYHSPEMRVDYSGNIIPREFSQQQKFFIDTCQKYDIGFIDMFPEYEEMYNETKHLPQGFTNTKISEGHTNKYGHRRIGEKLYEFINEE